MVLMVLVSDVMLCDWLVMVFSTWLTRPVSELTADVSAFFPAQYSSWSGCSADW
jgi:hypothetical protein